MSNRKSLFNNTSVFHIIVITISILFISTISCKKTEQEKEVTSEKKKMLTNSIGVKFLYISPGTFIQDVTLNRYEVSKSYYLGVTEVTVKQWETFIHETGYKTEAEIGDGASVLKFGNHPPDLDGKLFGYYWLKEKCFYWANPGFTQTENDPITCVKLNDINAFIKWLNNKEKTDTYYLPTWVEWEYACRAGSQTRFSFGDDEAELDKYAWYKENSGYKTHPVANKKPNAWGLYDMQGNVMEFVMDTTLSDHWRWWKGGSWYDDARVCQSRYSIMDSTDVNNYTNSALGFRLAKRL